MKKSLLTLGALSAIGATAVTGMSVASAATDTTSNDSRSSLITTLSEKFKLNKSEVQAVFDEQHAARVAERDQEMKDNLAQAVKDGELTQEQADKVATKFTELKASREASKDKSVEERRTVMKAEMSELKTWASENGIDLQQLRPMGGHGHGSGHSGPGGRDENSAPNS